MKKIVILTFAALCLTSCWTSIFTVAPTVEPVAPPKTVYTTTVTTPAPKHTTVTTVTVTNFNTDLSFYLDLNAVAAAFAEARNVAEFEQIINSSRYMINNLDLNRDGWIDYLRVIETHRGVYHTFLIQACLGQSMFQDVATLVAEHRPTALYVEVIGDRWLYGPNYIVRPVFVKRPPLWSVFGRPAYVAWSSPYYYGYWPSYYQKPKPIYLNHYQAYVHTYMTNHHYCHQCDYPKEPYYSGYAQMTQPNSHNDFAVRHPQDAFEQRVTQSLRGSNVSVRNAGQLREETERQASKPAAETTRTSSGSTTTRTPTGSATTRTSSSSSSSSTSGRTSLPASSSSASSSTTTRSSSSSATSTRTSSGSATTRTSSGSSSTRTAAPSTTIESRVSKSGTTRTTIKSTDANGRTTTIKRESTNNTRTAAPAASTRTSTGSSSSRTSSGSTSTRTSSAPTGGSSTRR